MGVQTVLGGPLAPSLPQTPRQAGGAGGGEKGRELSEEPAQVPSQALTSEPEPDSGAAEL